MAPISKKKKRKVQKISKIHQLPKTNRANKTVLNFALLSTVIFLKLLIE